MKELEKIYDPSSVEDKHYKKWVDAGYFHAERDPDKRPYTIVMPPPNITGQLHMGHAMDETWQDILIRYKRMQGYAALWVPGTDHASIATEAKIVAKMKEEGLTKQDLGRDRFLERAWDWKKQYGGRIVEQLKKLGCSCDWQRERFTMDEGCSKAVLKVFKKLYDDGLIYRGERIINWCPHCKTSISDAEVEYEEQDGFFWHLKYPVAGGDEFVELATTRPETMLGDTAIAVHPDDERYTHLHGKKVILPLVGKEIPVVCDTYVDREFGTGVVKITPAHDPNDFEVGVRHGLPVVKVLTDDAHMTQDCGKYAGMDRYEARKAIVADLEAGGYLASIEPHKHNVGTCYRCGTTVEPMVSKQWFVKMVPLAGPAIEAVRDGRIRFVPERFDKPYYNWMENTRDWCISRQLWWGHRIPAYYCDDCGEISVSATPLTVCPKCGKPVRQDEDVLDTWFSSQLWPFATMGWTEEGMDAPQMKQAYPTQVLSTARDIMGLWVARMVMASMYCTDRIPFEHVIIHPTVMAADGKPMSKSRGNGVDPLRLMEDYGADGMRFGLLMQVTGAQDLKFNEAKLESSRNFANKIRNAARFVTMNLDDYVPGAPEPVTPADRWIFSRLAGLVARVDEAYGNFEFGEITRELFSFFWNEFCDWYIEFSKARLNGSPEDRAACQRNLVFVLDQALRLLHPIMPFVTEEIYQQLPIDRTEAPYLIVAAWPDAEALAQYVDADAERAIDMVCETVSAIRSTRARYGISPKTQLAVAVKAGEDDIARLEAQRGLIEGMGNVASLQMAADVEKPAESSVTLAPGLEVYIVLSGLVDFEAERARLEKERAKLAADAAKLGKKLSNPGFLAKAAPEIVEKDRAKHAEMTDKLARVEAQLAELG